MRSFFIIAEWDFKVISDNFKIVGVYNRGKSTGKHVVKLFLEGINNVYSYSVSGLKWRKSKVDIVSFFQIILMYISYIPHDS